MLKRFFHDDRGTSAVEYGLLAALVAVVIIGSVTAVGTKLTTTFQGVSTALQGANN